MDLVALLQLIERSKLYNTCHIHTLMVEAKCSSGAVWDTSTCSWGSRGFEQATLWLLDDQLYLLTTSCRNWDFVWFGIPRDTVHPVTRPCTNLNDQRLQYMCSSGALPMSPVSSTERMTFPSSSALSCVEGWFAICSQTKLRSCSWQTDLLNISVCEHVGMLMISSKHHRA